MAHLNTVRFPEQLAAGAVYGPEFVTEIVPVQSGREKRNAVRQRALCVGDVSHAPRLAADFPELLKFFRAMNGRFNSFRFKDFSDYECSVDEGVVAQIDATHMQLQKKYATGSLHELRDIQQPIADTFVLLDGSTDLVEATDYTLDDATGIVTLLTTHSAADLVWAGEFDNAARFDTDKMATSVDAFEVFTWGGIPIREVRL